MVNLLQKLAEIQINHSKKLLGLAAILTIILGLGIPSIQLQTDFQESLPDNIDAVAASEKVENEFGSTDAIIVLIETNDKKLEEGYITDLRDPRMIQTLNFLDQQLQNEAIIEETNSVANLFNQTPETQQQVEQRLSQTPAQFYNRDYTATTAVVQLSEESTEDNIKKATKTIKENIEETPKYPGIKITTTGTPVVRTQLSNVLVWDSFTTITAASALILTLLTIARGRVYGPITFIPLFVGLIWTLGFMGHFNIPLSFATISLGSMILGLGVEYGSFITERILEEMKNNSVEQAIKTTVPNTGAAIIGSASTDGVGFMALLLATISFIRDLGITLALGEFLTVGSALIVTPAIMIEYERWKTK